MATFVQACQEADFNPATQTCVAPYWIPQPLDYPTLTIADAQQIGMSMALLLAVAWVFRRLGKAITQFN